MFSGQLFVIFAMFYLTKIIVSILWGVGHLSRSLKKKLTFRLKFYFWEAYLLNLYYNVTHMAMLDSTIVKYGLQGANKKRYQLRKETFFWTVTSYLGSPLLLLEVLVRLIVSHPDLAAPP